MATPEFIVELRKKIGHDLLWLPGCTAVVVHEGKVLLGQRSDNGTWGLITGIVEPGEDPGVAARRECLEETGVDVEVQALVGVKAYDAVRFPNGDVCQFLDHTFLCRYVSGEARVADDESLIVGWYDLADLPSIPAHQLERLRAALEFTGVTAFER
ncbi:MULTISPECIES: NUDIX hydrolase [unclassified Candidatus Sulfotelmatobacter]|uniref:NUDIX hydrolase n=1 Tax=unclassified Candidatus Sulfotelmatobacter TaxID=2635724 RepID=UPI001685CF61|nr:NUDIX domain-containing protein [Kocuria sp. cx-116]MBD2762764.1 NUDIX domain-containing protein [Kocuria sp. cx-116]